jgi:tRNA pseudouridine38-40 synthase
MTFRPHIAPDHKRLRFDITYCGTPWQGWQSLPSGQTIQDQLQRALHKSVGIDAVIHGSGRTDAGVHALHQVAHVDVPNSFKMELQAWKYAMNACLPKTISLIDVTEVTVDFHARFSAINKTYEYRIWRPRWLDPFLADRVCHVYGKLNLDSINTCMERIVGTHNFVRLSANRGNIPEVERRKNPTLTTRTIYDTAVNDEGDLLTLRFCGQGFLYKMIRMIVGSILYVAKERESQDWFNQLLDNSQGLQTTQMAAAGGLYLKKVTYPQHITT